MAERLKLTMLAETDYHLAVTRMERLEHTVYGSLAVGMAGMVLCIALCCVSTLPLWWFGMVAFAGGFGNAFRVGFGVDLWDMWFFLLWMCGK